MKNFVITNQQGIVIITAFIISISKRSGGIYHLNLDSW